MRPQVKKLEAECAKVQKQTRTSFSSPNYLSCVFIYLTSPLDHDIFLSTVYHRIRFQPIGVDPLSNKYYLLSPSPGSSFPDTSPTDKGDSFPLPWCILIHGKAFPGSSSTESKLPQKVDLKGKGKEVVPGEKDTPEELGWSTVRSTAHMEKLASYIEYLVRKAAFDKKVALGGKEVEEEDEEEEITRKYAELVAGVRCFADFVAVEKEELEEEERRREVKGKLRGSRR